MGNSTTTQPKFEHGSLTFLLANNEFEGGKTLKGIVKLNLTQEFPGRYLYIAIRGQEVRNWVSVEAKRDGTQLLLMKGINKFLDQHILYSFPLIEESLKSLPPG